MATGFRLPQPAGSGRLLLPDGAAEPELSRPRDALARRGRGETDATSGHSLEDESRDAALLAEIGEPVFLLGHSYGAQVALAASGAPERIRALKEYPFDPERFRDLRIPVLLLIGTESPRDLYVTDALAATLPEARIEELPARCTKE